MVNNIRNIIVSSVGQLPATIPVHAKESTEQQKYNIMKQSDEVELRSYAPHLVAAVTVEADSMPQAASKGFGPLADYIFGDNQAAIKIAMTAPVMTAKNESGAFVVCFSMPSKWTMATLPIPNNDKVELAQIKAEKRVAYRLVGDRCQARIDEAAARIDAFLKAEKLEASSSLIVAGYDGISVPIERKRWEVMRIVR